MMNENETLREQMWDLVYGLLSADEVTALHKQIKSDPAAARLYAEVRLQADLVASAAKVEDPSVTLSVPDEARKVQPAAKSRTGSELGASPFARPAGKSSRAPSYRLANAITAIAATALLALIGYGFFGSRQQGPVVSNNLVVAEFFAQTPMPSGLTQSAKVRSRTASGEPVSTSLAYRIVDDRGDVVDRGEVQTDAAGEGQLTIRGEAVRRGNSVVLTLADSESSVSATEADVMQSNERFSRADNGVARVVVPLPARDEPTTTDITLDKDVYQKGDTLYFSAHSMGAFSKQRVPAPTDLKLMDNDGREYAPEEVERGTDSVVKSGKFVIPEDAPGPWRLVEPDRQTGRPVTRYVVPEGLARDRSSDNRLRAEQNELSKERSPGSDEVASAKAAEGKSENTKLDSSKEKRETKLAMAPPAPGARGAPAAPPAAAPSAPGAPAPSPPVAGNLAGRGHQTGELEQLEGKSKVAAAATLETPPGGSGGASRFEEYKQLAQQGRQAGQEKKAAQGDALTLEVPSGLENKLLLVVASKEGAPVGRLEYDGIVRVEDRVAKSEEPASLAPSQATAPLPAQKPGTPIDESEQLTAHVALSLPPEADGELTIDYFDRSVEPPVLLKRQRVYRAGAHKLNIQALAATDTFEPQQNVRFKFQVTNQDGEEVSGAHIGARLIRADDLADKNSSLQATDRQFFEARSPLPLKGLEEKGRETTEEKVADAKKNAALGQGPPESRPALADAVDSAADAPVKSDSRLKMAMDFGGEVDSLKEIEQNVTAETLVLAELPQEMLLASNNDQVQGEVTRQEQARETQAAAFRQLVARVLLIVATGTLVILGVLAIMHWSAQAKFWAPAMTVVAASFIVGFIWLVNGPFPGAERTTAAKTTGLDEKLAMAPRNHPAEEAKEGLPEPTSRPITPKPELREEAGYGFKNPLERSDGIPRSGSPLGGLEGAPNERGGDQAPGLAGSSSGGGYGGGKMSPAPAGAGGAEPNAPAPKREAVRTKSSAALPLPAAETPAPRPAEREADKESGALPGGTAGKGMTKEQGAKLDDLRKKELAEKLGQKKKSSEDARPAATIAPKGAKDAVAEDFDKSEAKSRRQARPLLWEPNLAANEKGEAEIDLKLPSEPGEYWLMIDAYGPGGVGKLQKRLLVRVPSAAEPAPAAKEKAK